MPRPQHAARPLTVDFLHWLAQYEHGMILLAMLDAHPHLNPGSVKTCLKRLKEKGYLASEAVSAQEKTFPASSPPHRYWVTDAGMAVVRGERPFYPRREMAVSADGWQPAPWVHPIRARALGLTK